MHSRRYGTGGFLTLPKFSGGINRSSSSPLALSRLASPGVGISSGAHLAGEGVEATVSGSSCVPEGRGVVPEAVFSASAAGTLDVGSVSAMPGDRQGMIFRNQRPANKGSTAKSRGAWASRPP